MWGNQKAPQFYQNTSVFLQVGEPGIKWSPSFSNTFSNSWAHFRVARWIQRNPLYLSVFGGFDFAHLVAVWIVLITMGLMKDPCFVQRPHNIVLEKATRGVTYQESQVLEEVNNTWFNGVRKEHKCWLGLWPSIFFFLFFSRQLFPHHWMECR